MEQQKTTNAQNTLRRGTKLEPSYFLISSYSMDVSLSELRELVTDREAWRAVIHGVAKSRTWLSDWSDLIWSQKYSDENSIIWA